ncbi:hypothetical protein ACTFTM_12020 [Micromonospora sp. RB23]
MTLPAFLDFDSADIPGELSPDDAAYIRAVDHESVNRIDFGGGASWWASPHEQSKQRARDPQFPLWLRVRYAAEGWSNRIGHAEMSKGQLAGILGYEDRYCRATVSAVSRAVSQAIGKGLLDPSSGPSCLVMPYADHQQAGRGTRFCREHRIVRT